MPVHARSAIAGRPPVPAPTRSSSLQDRYANQTRPEPPPPPGSNFGKTNPRGSLESTKPPQKDAKTNLNEPRRLIIGKAWTGRSYHASSIRLGSPRGSVFDQDTGPGFPSLARWRRGDRKPGATPKPCGALAVGSLYKWAPAPAQMPENRKKHPRPKAGMSHGINNMSPKWGLERKLECPLESAKQGLHRKRGRATPKAGMSFEINKKSTVDRSQLTDRKLECHLESTRVHS